MNEKPVVAGQSEEKQKKTIDNEKLKKGLVKTLKVIGIVAGVVAAVGATIGICKVVSDSKKQGGDSVSNMYASSGGSAHGDDYDDSPSNYDRVKANRDHHANQMNPNSDAYKARMDNHSNQCNPNNWRYGGGKK